LLAGAAALVLGAGLTGCAFLGGAAVGAGAAGTAYEVQNKEKLDELEDDYAEGKISRDEYLRRKREIDEGSVIY
jgi:hypothetical protein